MEQEFVNMGSARPPRIDIIDDSELASSTDPVTAHALETYGFRAMHIHQMTQHETMDIPDNEHDDSDTSSHEQEKESSDQQIHQNVRTKVAVIDDSDEDVPGPQQSVTPAKYPRLDIVDDSQQGNEDLMLVDSIENHENQLSKDQDNNQSSVDMRDPRNQIDQAIGSPLISENPSGHEPEGNVRFQPGIIGSDGIMRFYSPSWNPPESSNRENTKQNPENLDRRDEAVVVPRCDELAEPQVRNMNPNWKGKEKENNNGLDMRNDITDHNHVDVSEGEREVVNSQQPTGTTTNIMEEVRATQTDNVVVDLCQLIARNQPAIERMNEARNSGQPASQVNVASTPTIANPYSSTVRNAPDIMSQFIHNGIHPSQVCNEIV